jgi:hypothetical protein
MRKTHTSSTVEDTSFGNQLVDVFLCHGTHVYFIHLHILNHNAYKNGCVNLP